MSTFRFALVSVGVFVLTFAAMHSGAPKISR